MSRAWVFKKGDRCGRFLIEGRIGMGASGEVYRATDPENLDQAVAIKVLALSRIHDARSIQRMNEEALLQRSLDDPHVVRVFALGTMPNGSVWIAMEFLQGSTLRERIFRLGALPLPYAIGYAIDIASGMNSVHDYGAIHRDLKPENLFVTSKGRVKILDFGVAKLELLGVALTDPGSHPGTWPYMSPEQAHGHTLDRRSDIFSLGLIFVEMVTGRPLWVPERLLERPTLFEFCKLYERWEPIDLHDLDPAVPSYVAELIKKALAKNPVGRQDSMYDLRRDLRAAERQFFMENPEWEREIEKRERERQRHVGAQAHAMSTAGPKLMPTLEMRGKGIRIPTPFTVSAPADRRFRRMDDTVPYQAVERLRVGLFVRIAHAVQAWRAARTPRARAMGVGIAMGIAFTAVLLIRNDVFELARPLLRAMASSKQAIESAPAPVMAEAPRVQPAPSSNSASMEPRALLVGAAGVEAPARGDDTDAAPPRDSSLGHVEAALAPAAPGMSPVPASPATAVRPPARSAATPAARARKPPMSTNYDEPDWNAPPTATPKTTSDKPPAVARPIAVPF